MLADEEGVGDMIDPVATEAFHHMMSHVFLVPDRLVLGRRPGERGDHVAPIVRLRSEHLLAIEVACARQTDRMAKRNITGVFQHWDCIDPGWNPGGIWRPVRLERTGPVRISRLRVLCREADATRASISPLMSTPVTWPGATIDAARMATAPVPVPRSSTRSPVFSPARSMTPSTTDAKRRSTSRTYGCAMRFQTPTCHANPFPSAS